MGMLVTDAELGALALQFTELGGTGERVDYRSLAKALATRP